MTRLSSITLVFLVTLAVQGQPLELGPKSGMRSDPSAGKPIGPTKDKDGKPLYSGRTLEAWVGDLDDKDVLVREEAIEVLAQVGKPARSATARIREFLKADSRNLRIRAALAVWKVAGDSKGVPAVLAEGLKDASSAVKRDALVALGGMGADAAVAANAVIECLDDPDPTLRNAAATTLQQLGPAALPALLASLKSKSPVVRQHTLVHLGNYMVAHLGKEHIPALTPCLRDDTLPCRVEAARLLWALGQTGPPVVAALLEGVKAPDGSLQTGILQTLTTATPRPKTLLPILQVCLDGTNAYARVQAARLLFGVEKKPQLVLPIYLEILRDPAGQNRGYANYVISALVDLKADALPALPRLVELLKTPNYYVSYEVRGVLANIGAPAVAPLVEILQSSTLPANSNGYSAAIDALGRIGAPSTKAVLPLLSSRDDAVRVRAIQVVSALAAHAKDAVPKLIDALGDRSASVRNASLQALGNLGDLARPAVPRILELAKGSDSNVRLLGLQALASIRPDTKDVVPLCLPLLRDPNASIRLSSLQLLVAVAPDHKAVLPSALKMLDDPATRTSAMNLLGGRGATAASAVPRIAKFIADPDENTKRSAIYALSQIGPAARAAAPALLDLLQSPDANTVSAAAYALGNIKPDAGASLPTLTAFVEKSRDTSAVPILNLIADYGKSGEKAFPALLAILEDAGRPAQVRACAARALSRVSPARAAKEAMPAMRKLLAVQAQRGNVAAAILTAVPADKEAIALLEAQLDHASPSTRADACSIVAEIGPAAKRFLPRLRELCKDKGYYTRSSAAMAAYHITKDAKEALPTLEAMLGDTAQQYSQGYAAYYLGELGLAAKPLLPKLRELRGSADTYTRGQAISATHKIEKAVEAASPRKSPDPDEKP